MDFVDYASLFSPAALLYNTYSRNRRTILADMTGKSQKENTQEADQAQIDYENYLREGNERALADWNKNVGSKGRTIRYPELSYAGQIYRSNTSITRASLGYDTADANYVGGLPYKTAGLYGVFSRVARTL